jgi:nitric oxide reductase NorD protein
VPEAEDVLIEAASHATAWVREVWERRGPGESGSGFQRRRLEAWQTAWLGRAWPVLEAEPPAPPGLVSRALRRPPPWRARPADLPATDGARIFLPRPWLTAMRSELRDERALLAVLGLARRLARGASSGPPGASRLVRDLCGLLEGACADAAIARDFPGLREPLGRLRRRALAARPAPRRLRPTERAVEAFACALLAEPPERSRLETLVSADAPPAALAARAAQRGKALDEAGYRGLAPVLHWGEATAGTASAARPGATDGARPRPAGASPPSASLPRPLGRAPDPEETARPAPFVLAFGDGHLTVDEPGAARPPDTGDAEDPEVLASEMARLEQLPRVRREGEVREVIEGGEACPASPRRTDPGPEASGWIYPEWDVTRRGYRARGCRVRERPLGVRDAHRSPRSDPLRSALQRRLRRQLEALRPRRERLHRQPEGDDLDVGAWVTDWADLRAGRAPDGRLYTRERRSRRDVAVTLLLDASGSTESWVDGSRHVIDVVKEAAVAFGEALASVGDRHAILAFSGQGAGDVRVWRLKGFGEPSGAAVRSRIGALAPDAFTRLGGALRHATAGLARQPARARLLLLLSDGKPQDEDGYEGDYGIEDARQAVAEARLAGVRVFAVTVDREGSAYLPRLFGPYGYTVIQDAAALPERLPDLYRRLTAGA